MVCFRYIIVNILHKGDGGGGDGGGGGDDDDDDNDNNNNDDDDDDYYYYYYYNKRKTCRQTTCFGRNRPLPASTYKGMLVSARPGRKQATSTKLGIYSTAHEAQYTS